MIALKRKKEYRKPNLFADLIINLASICHRKQNDYKMVMI